MVETGINFWPPFGCSEETIPAGAILAPETGPLPGASVEITTTGVSDASGIEEVRFYFEYCPTVTPPTGCTGNRVLIGIDKSTPYAQTWTFPGCAYDNSKWTIHVAFEDVCGNVRFQFTDDLVLNGRGC
jgi:hypothetical protein